MFKKVLVANRGEIAVRIIQTLREMGITSVAVFSNADRHSLHVLLADEAICIGGPRATDSYLNMRNVVSAAILSGAEAVHPGFGFLSENAEFAKLVTDAGLAFIGPKPTAIEQMGDKAVARQTMIDIGVPVIPGSRPLQDVDTALAAAQAIGYPLMLKASAGGGGKGIRKLATADDLTAEFAGAQAEAQAAFGDPTMYLEKVIVPAKHVEVQVLRDQQGHVSVFPERDCSLQRHSQKMIEESPCPVLTSPERAKLLHLAETIADGVDYLNAGTIEFLMDQQHHFYFMEMNTRIQVEHPITEMVTGVDLVQAQLRIAAGEDVELTTPEPSGVAIECRL
ncbi:ATP-grasp domain-containing protein, partial [Lacticaseibacillus rhamnosus]|nr:ATP-grasp domain-containing protein [Lacticaseibacillus rhamnosus]